MILACLDKEENLKFITNLIWKYEKLYKMRISSALTKNYVLKVWRIEAIVKSKDISLTSGWVYEYLPRILRLHLREF